MTISTQNVYRAGTVKKSFARIDNKKGQSSFKARDSREEQTIKKNHSYLKATTLLSLLAVFISSFNLSFNFLKDRDEKSKIELHQKQMTVNGIKDISALLVNIITDEVEIRGNNVNLKLEKINSNTKPYLVITIKPVNTDYKGVILVSKDEVGYNTKESTIPEQLWPYYLNLLYEELRNFFPKNPNVRMGVKT